MKENKPITHNLDFRGKTIANARLVNCKVEGVQTNQKVVEDIEELTGAQLDALKCGDIVVEGSNGHYHAYLVAYKHEEDGELSLVYTDHETIEEVYYEKTEGEWAHVVTDIVVPGASSSGNEEAVADSGSDTTVVPDNDAPAGDNDGE